MLKAFFQVQDGVNREEVIKPEDAQAFQQIETLSIEQAEQRLKSLGLNSAAFKALYDKKD